MNDLYRVLCKAGASACFNYCMIFTKNKYPLQFAANTKLRMHKENKALIYL